MGYKYRNGSTPDHVTSISSDSTSTKKKPYNTETMSDSIRHDESRLADQIRAGNKKDAGNTADRMSKNVKDYMIKGAEADSAAAASIPAKVRKQVNSSPDQAFGDGLTLTSRKSAERDAADVAAKKKAAGTQRGSKPE